MGQEDEHRLWMNSRASFTGCSLRPLETRVTGAL